MTRREMLLAGGGLTFLALVPSRRGIGFAPPGDDPALPVFTALPYLQPGPDSGTLVPGDESLVIAWQTNAAAAEFALEVGDHPGRIVPNRTERYAGDDEDREIRFNYAATVSHLALNRRYRYRVSMNGRRVAEGWFTTRKPRGVRTRFVAFGDNSYGDISDRMIAYQALRARPDFVVNTGDNVYEDGTDDEYARHFFPVYNADIAAPRVGAPLLRAVPFYSVLGNHDVHGKDAQKHPVADFAAHSDALAYFTNLHLPLNGLTGTFAPPLSGPEDPIAHFRASAGGRYPRMGTYWFDYGDAHFLCLDSNLYVDPNDTALQTFVEEDLRSAVAPWKFVVFHHPCFNVGAEHYAEQHMRVLAPIFERCGVAVVFHGHEHNYQRTLPLRFEPRDTAGAANVGTKARKVPGAFRVDRRFDGHQETRADGVVYLTTGAGGKHLYEADWGQKARTYPDDGNIDYVSRFVADRHSLTVVDMDATSLTIRQIDQWGATIDHCHLTQG